MGFEPTTACLGSKSSPVSESDFSRALSGLIPDAVPASAPSRVTSATASPTRSFRHLYAARMKDHIRIERLAALMRTSVAMLERTYGKQSDESFEAIITEADQAVWGSASTQSP